MNNPFDHHDAGVEITETAGGDSFEINRTLRVGPDLQARMHDNYLDGDEAAAEIALDDVVDGDRDRVEMLSRDAFDDDLDRITSEMTLCDERMAATIDPETGQPFPHLEGDYNRFQSRRNGLQFSLENQEALANIGRQSRVDAYEANVAEDAKRVSQMEKILAGLSIRDGGKDVL